MSRLGSMLAGWSAAWARLEPERRNGVLLFSGLAAVILIALAIIGYGYYTENIAYKNDTVLTVGDTKISYASLERRLLRELRRGNLSLNTSTDEAVLRALFLIEKEALLHQGAAGLGISVSDEEIDARIRSVTGVPQDAPQETFAELYRQDVLRSGLTVSEYRAMTESDLVEEKLRTLFGDAVPAEGEQVDILLILSGDRAKMDEAKQRLDAGEPFEDVVVGLSVHASASDGGAAGWFADGALPPAVNEAAFSLAIGATSDVIDVNGSLYIIRPRAREVRPIDEDGRNEVISQKVDNLINDTREAVGSQTSLTTTHLVKLSERVIDALSNG